MYANKLVGLVVVGLTFCLHLFASGACALRALPDQALSERAGTQ